MPISGDQALMLGEASLAAATSDEYYFPPGYQAGVGVANVEGRYREVILKRIYLKGTDSNLNFQGAYALERDNTTIKWIIGPIAAALVGMRYAANDNGAGIIVECNTRIKDCRNIVLRIRNSDGANAKSHSAILVYEPIK